MGDLDVQIIKSSPVRGLMMRFSRRRSSLSFLSSAMKTALNANHAGAFLQHSAVPCSSETT